MTHTLYEKRCFGFNTTWNQAIHMSYNLSEIPSEKYTILALGVILWNVSLKRLKPLLYIFAKKENQTCFSYDQLKWFFF